MSVTGERMGVWNDKGLQIALQATKLEIKEEQLTKFETIQVLESRRQDGA